MKIAESGNLDRHQRVNISGLIASNPDFKSLEFLLYFHLRILDPLFWVQFGMFLFYRILRVPCIHPTIILRSKG